jgi:hypothetical protein
MKKFFIALILTFISQNVFSQELYSMRRCLMLPISDSVGGALGTKVYDYVEHELKSSNWCYYQKNSDLLGIFSRYRDNLPVHLKNPEVLKVISGKMKVGSIIRVTMISELNGLEIGLEVLGENGTSIYFSEKAIIPKQDLVNAGQTIINWLRVYSKTIPYDGKISGILGDQVTIDIGKGYPIKMGQTYIVKRKTGEKKHPLLNKVVEFESTIMAEGKIFSISDNQALGQIKVYNTGEKLRIGDWIRLEEVKDDLIFKQMRAEDTPEEPGKLGIASVYLVGSLSQGSVADSSTTKRLGGKLLGFDVRGEGWITRNYFVGAQISKTLGAYTVTSGTATESKINVSNTIFKLTGGYRYLPMGFFYGPQVDFYGGIASHTYGWDYSKPDKFGETNFSGILLGLGLNTPINKDYRGLLRTEFIPFPKFDDRDGVYSGAKSSSVLGFEMGARHTRSTNFMLDALIFIQTASAKFGGSVKEVSYKDTGVKIGATFQL